MTRNLDLRVRTGRRAGVKNGRKSRGKRRYRSKVEKGEIILSLHIVHMTYGSRVMVATLRLLAVVEHDLRTIRLHDEQ
jgi:hypothetical protein